MVKSKQRTWTYRKVRLEERFEELERRGEGLSDVVRTLAEAAEEDTTVQELVAEALDMLFQSRGRAAIARQ